MKKIFYIMSLFILLGCTDDEGEEKSVTSVIPKNSCIVKNNSET